MSGLITMSSALDNSIASRLQNFHKMVCKGGPDMTGENKMTGGG